MEAHLYKSTRILNQLLVGDGFHPVPKFILRFYSSRECVETITGGHVPQGDAKTAEALPYVTINVLPNGGTIFAEALPYVTINVLPNGGTIFAEALPNKKLNCVLK